MRLFFCCCFCFCSHLPVGSFQTPISWWPNILLQPTSRGWSLPKPQVAALLGTVFSNILCSQLSSSALNASFGLWKFPWPPAKLLFSYPSSQVQRCWPLMLGPSHHPVLCAIITLYPAFFMLVIHSDFWSIPTTPFGRGTYLGTPRYGTLL